LAGSELDFDVEKRRRLAEPENTTMKSERDKKLISRAMSLIGSITTKRKREHAASIAHLGGKARWKDHVKKPKLPTKSRVQPMKPAT
jgi:hypothetical protein